MFELELTTHCAMYGLFCSCWYIQALYFEIFLNKSVQQQQSLELL